MTKKSPWRVCLALISYTELLLTEDDGLGDPRSLGGDFVGGGP